MRADFWVKRENRSRLVWKKHTRNYLSKTTAKNHYIFFFKLQLNLAVNYLREVYFI